VYESNYSSGLRVLEMSRIEEGMLREVAYFDTYPEDDLIDFYGNWSNYPYFESGTIIASDMNNGLFVLKLNMGADIISKHPENQTGCGMGGINFSVEAEEAEGTKFRWQRFAGQKYIYIGEGSVSLGTQTPDLTVIPSSLTKGNLIRCEITTAYGDVYYTYPASYEYPEGDIVTPDADFSYSMSNSTEVVFTNNSTDASFYLWDFGDGSSSTLPNPTHVFEAGIHEINLIAFNDCAFAQTKMEVNTTPLATNPVTSGISIFPNPTSRYISFTEPVAYFEIQDLSGRVAMQSNAASARKPIDLIGLKPGVYLVVLTTSESREIDRLVVR
ncbi:MAG: T9SS type A sorting domain-containing protein, partial [Cyclobacteriaceae bacterium]